MDTTMLSERWHLRVKKETLHRNVNSRVDCLVEMLIRAVEDLAESNEVNDRRRLARSSFRKQQTTIRHRSAVTFLAKNPQVLCVGDNKWEVASESQEATHTVTFRSGCNCGPSPDNVHSPLCESMAVVQANMNALVKEDTDEADVKLQAIVDLLREASEIQSSAFVTVCTKLVHRRKKTGHKTGAYGVILFHTMSEFAMKVSIWSSGSSVFESDPNILLASVKVGALSHVMDTGLPLRETLI
ncbi:hypothetical protein Q1695_015653 [Nippostrongylus brasiliensis]|nr:hypothetical protein Q1695_015653 [Nippostrongylus brasiliensis]